MQVGEHDGALSPMHSHCASGQMLVYGWVGQHPPSVPAQPRTGPHSVRAAPPQGRNAHGLDLPDGVGFEVGDRSGFSHAVLEIHYLRPPASPEQRDSSGVVMHLTRAEVPLAAGIAMFATARAPRARALRAPRRPAFFPAVFPAYFPRPGLRLLWVRAPSPARGRGGRRGSPSRRGTRPSTCPWTAATTARSR